MAQTTRDAAIKMFLSRRAIVDAWVARVLADDAIPSARRVGDSQLRGYVPRFLDAVIDALRGETYAGDVRDRTVDVGRVHVLGRIHAGFTLDEVLRTLGHFRATLFEQVPSGGKAHALLVALLDEARALALQGYARENPRA